MMHFSASLRISLTVALVLGLWAGGAAWSQVKANVQANRIATPADLGPMMQLTGHVPRWATAANDRGEIAASRPIRLTLLLSRSAARQAAFEQMLADQQNPHSRHYRQWLTPAEVGERFGPTPDDVAAVQGWLRGQGFEVRAVAPSRIFVEALGPASAVARALSTSLHLFGGGRGEERVAAASEPAVPMSLASVVVGVEGLTELPVRPYHGLAQAAPRSVEGAQEPRFTGDGGQVHYVFPGDFARIYDVSAATNAGYNGSGVRVAVIGRSRIADTDITQLQALAGLAQKAPNVVLIPGSPDPGLVPADQAESTLDISRVATIAPGLEADLVIAAESANGISAAMQYNVNTLMDPVMTISYGLCEAQVPAASVRFYDALFAQAAAEGISTLVSSGDSAAAGCSTAFAAPTGTETLGMGNYLCSSSYVTCLGGTEFADAGLGSTYWSAANSATYSSALGYIPEGAWNEPSYSMTSDGVTAIDYQIAGSGSGASAVIGKPVWQTGVGVPSDGARDIPDVAFSAAGHDGYFACLASEGSGFDCSKGGGVVYSGTSAAAPDMAAIVAMLVQRLGKAVGNLNPLLYGLAASAPAAFHDATPASSGVGTACTTTTASMCNNSVASPTSVSGGLAGYPLQVGYDLVTGLGSLDVTNFLDAAATLETVKAATTVVLAASAVRIDTAERVVFTGAVTSGGSGTPTGTVQFYSNGVALGGAASVSGGVASSAAVSFAEAGTYAISAVYSGDGEFSGSSASGLSLVVSAIPAMALTASPASLTLTAGGDGASTITVSVTGFSAPVSLGCGVAFSGADAVDPPTCAFSSSVVTPGFGGSGSSVVTVGTTLPHAQGGVARVGMGAFGGVWLAGLLAVVRRKRRFGAVLLLGLCGCGGTVGSSVPAQVLVGTSPGAYTVTVTASSAGVAAATTSVVVMVR
jgi:subtilase family serine protease